MNKQVVKWASTTITVLVVVLFAWYFFSHIDDFALLLDINIVFIVLIFALNLATMIVNGLFMKIVLTLFRRQISLKESIRVVLISTVGNFFAPAGSGLAFRAVYLKKRHKLPYSDYLSITFCNYIIVFFVSAILGILGLYMVSGWEGDVAVYSLYGFFGALLVASVVAFFIRFSKVRQSKFRIVVRLQEVIVSISGGWRKILGDKKTLAYLSAIVIFNAILMILTAYFIMQAINIQLSIGGLILYSILGSLSLFINLTPGNLGIKESVYIVFSGIIGLSTAQILSAALIERLITFTTLLLLWLRFGNISSKERGDRTALDYYTK